jgi:uncharacterized protein (DUF1697 family)
MKTFVALLRAVNVGGTGKLPMPELKAMCEEIGLCDVRTYIASGNVIFRSGDGAGNVKKKLEQRLKIYAGKPLGVIVRSDVEMADMVARNPFAAEAGNRVMAICLDEKISPSLLDDVSGLAAHERIVLGEKAIFVFYGEGMGNSKLRIPSAKNGTARNMNTIAKLAELSAG